MVDYETVACGDKFGNIFINRLPQRVSSSVDEDPTGSGILHEKGHLQGAAHKTNLMAHYHVGGIVTSINKTVLVAGGRDVLLYTTLNGSVGALIPFTSKDDIEFMTTLEMVSPVRSDISHASSEPISLMLSYPLNYSTCEAKTPPSLVETTYNTEVTTFLSRLSSMVISVNRSLCCHTTSNNRSHRSSIGQWRMC